MQIKTQESCASCRFFNLDEGSPEDDRDGECRRRSPVQFSQMAGFVVDMAAEVAWNTGLVAGRKPEEMTKHGFRDSATCRALHSEWAIVGAADWCGEYSPQSGVTPRVVAKLETKVAQLERNLAKAGKVTPAQIDALKKNCEFLAKEIAALKFPLG